MKNYYNKEYTGMTKGQAIQAMIDGKKVTHRYFNENEYVYMINELIHDENNFQYNINVFWADRRNIGWNDGWEIYKEKI